MAKALKPLDSSPMSKPESASKPDGGQNQDGQTTIGVNSRITLGFLLSVVAILVPMISSSILLYTQQKGLEREIVALNNRIADRLVLYDGRLERIQMEMQRAWTRQMMVLFTTELQLRNSPSNLVVPNSEDIARKLKLDDQVAYSTEKNTRH